MGHTGEGLDMSKINDELNKDQELPPHVPDAADRALPPLTPEEIEVLAANLASEAEHVASLGTAQAKADKSRIAFGKWMVRAWIFACFVGLLALLGAIGWAYRGEVVQDWNKYGSHETQCIFKVGDRTVKGNREYSYRYFTIFNWRLYDLRHMEEKTFVDMPNNGVSVLAHMSDGTHPKVNVKDAEPGRYPLPRAEAYSFFMDNGKNSDVISYKDMCK